GDPETQVVLPMLDADLYEIFEAVYNHELDKLDIKWHKGSCACVVMASGGYPESYPKGIEMNGFDDKGQIDGCFVYHAGTKLSEDGKFLTNGGRVIGVTAKGDTLQNALDTAYKGVSGISFEGAHYRKDIGQRALKALK
ncbi:MAG: phosphoribosylamine--glycine ligase, partial [Ruminococcus sp.]|nr:phosphoribosylamine--glycine ligase [Ruminococcus sp.]